MSKSYAVFYSPSLTKDAQISVLHGAFERCGLVAKFFEVGKCSIMAAQSNYDVLVAAGGDGTVNCVAEQAYKHKKPLGIVPMGTLNHFAKELGLPLVPLQAVEIIAKDERAKFDIGTAGDQVFINNASIGIYPSVVRMRSALEPKLTKWPAAVGAIVTVATKRLHLYHFSITLDGRTLERRSSMLFVGNNEYGIEGFGLPERNGIRDGKLQLFVLKTKRIDKLFQVGVRLVLGKKLPESYIERFTCGQMIVEIKGHKQVWLAYDGEVTQAKLPLAFTLVPRALTTIVHREKS